MQSCPRARGWPLRCTARRALLLHGLLLVALALWHAGLLGASVWPSPHGAAWSARDLQCIGWHPTRDCPSDGDGDAGADADQRLPCDAEVPPGAAGHCELRHAPTGAVLRVMQKGCARDATLPCRRAADFHAYKTRALQHREQPPGVAPRARGAAPVRGIVMAVHERLLEGAWATLRLLRASGCALPVELWCAPDELGTNRSALLTLLLRDRRVALRAAPGAAFRGSFVKPYALFHSRFDHVLVLDADCVPAADPTPLFEAAAFRATGALFWPDLWQPRDTPFGLRRDSLVWELLGLPFVDMFEQESGQLVVDRRRHARALHALMFLAGTFGEFMRPLGLGHGDKDLYRFAWLLAGHAFHLEARPPGLAGVVDAGGGFCGLTLVQYDALGRPAFFHRNLAKLSTARPARLWTHLWEYTGSAPAADYRIEIRREEWLTRVQACLRPRNGTPGAVSPTNGTRYARLEEDWLGFAREAAGLAPLTPAPDDVLHGLLGMGWAASQGLPRSINVTVSRVIRGFWNLLHPKRPRR